MKNYYAVRSYMRFLSRYKWRVASVFTLFLVADIALAFVPVLIGQLVETVSAAGTVDSGRVWLYAILLVASSSVHDIVWRMSELSYMKLLLPVTFEYETQLYGTVLRKPYPYFVGKFTGKIASYVVTLRRETEDLMEKFFWSYVNLLVVGVSIIVILFTVNVLTGVVFLAGVALLVLIGSFTIQPNMRREKRYSDIKATKDGRVVDVMSNFINIKSFATELREHKRFAAEQQEVEYGRKKLFLTSIVFWGSMSIIIRNIIWPVTILMNIRLFLQGSLSIGELTTFLSVIFLFSSQVWEFVWEISQFKLILIRLEEPYRYLFGKTVLTDLDASQSGSESLDGFGQSIQLDDVGFAYPDQPGQMVLDGVSLTIKKDEKIGIVGHSGSGKTTLVKLLLGYYPLTTGSVSVGGAPVDTEELLSIISYVPQDTTMFNRTVAENIAYAVTDGVASQADIEQVAKDALAHEFIDNIPEKYDAVVGERGVKLSTGQRQRLSIARSMLQDKPLLILDEATSALDSENEALVQQSLERLWKGRAVISIAHRLSTLRKMDRIVVMDSGRIVEQGTIKQLLAKKGAFHELWTHQVDGMIID